ncbi:MAG: tRNA uridine-5-carboxymethylaminomethyl(34) synthesis GTPase MnmE, partial [Bacteroidota bacterium]|nr:tRNA uridine-5-carboxymethylaminomethyl(34) synthesis GTPase MnmE [Bacteroidota bacterium]
HYHALHHTLIDCNSILNALHNNTPSDFIAQDIRYALHHLGSITGHIATDDLLSSIFSSFCIGK